MGIDADSARQIRAGLKRTILYKQCLIIKALCPHLENFN